MWLGGTIEDRLSLSLAAVDSDKQVGKPIPVADKHRPSNVLRNKGRRSCSFWQKNEEDFYARKI